MALSGGINDICSILFGLSIYENIYHCQKWEYVQIHWLIRGTGFIMQLQSQWTEVIEINKTGTIQINQ